MIISALNSAARHAENDKRRSQKASGVYEKNERSNYAKNYI